MSEEKKEEKSISETNLYFETNFKNNKNLFLLSLEIKENKLIMKITDTNSIGNGLYKCEWTKENFYEIEKSFGAFDNINEIFEKIKEFIVGKRYSLEFDDNFNILKIILDVIVFNKNIKKILELKRVEMNDKDIINQLWEKVKALNALIGQGDSNAGKLKDLNSNILIKDEYNMISDQIEEKTKQNILTWEKVFTAGEDGDTAENFHSKWDGIENTVILVKTKNIKDLEASQEINGIIILVDFQMILKLFYLV